MENKKTSIEAKIEKMYKLNGIEKNEIDPLELIITDNDSNLIELDIVISDKINIAS